MPSSSNFIDQDLQKESQVEADDNFAVVSRANEDGGDGDATTATNATAAAAAALPPPIPESTAYWDKEPYAWSTSLDYTPPLLTSSVCSEALYKLFHNTYYEDNEDEEWIPNFLLSVVVESSSHPSGLTSLYAQPWMYAGGGLGNIDECPLQTCIAGGRQTDSLTFASVCMVPECSAYDLASDDFVSVTSRQLDFALDNNNNNQVRHSQVWTETRQWGREYVQTLDRIAHLNKFLNTGWTCGNFIVPWVSWPFGIPYIAITCLFLILAFVSTTIRKQKSETKQKPPGLHPDGTRKNNNTDKSSCGDSSTASNASSEERSALLGTDNSGSRRPSNDDRSNASECNHQRESHEATNSSKAVTQKTPVFQPPTEAGQNQHPFWSAFNVTTHLWRLVTRNDHSQDTACLDGLRVGSIFWIMLGHVMAIQSSSGAGYANPANFLPPSGLTATFAGQLLFSSRLAVDTFLVISGFLVVYVLHRKLPLRRAPATMQRSVVYRYLMCLPSLLITRVVRILPLYAMTLGFYTQIAPHLGSGPFWHQWIGLLKPCHDAGWTNFLFVNNFLPFNTPTLSTCFYHSWYLAVDMQLFLVAPFFVFLFQSNPTHGKRATIALLLASVFITTYLSFARQWSINTFDGAAVNRYDAEAYAKPHVRAQSYLAGMYVAMLLLDEKQRQQQCTQHSQQPNCRPAYTWKHSLVMLVSLMAMGLVTFVTVTGAYAQRPCTYQEDPLHGDECGSIWSPLATFVYTALSRTIWSVGVAIVMHLSIGRSIGRGNWVSSILSWRCWTPLSQLSFGVYLVHPIIIFIWQLGDREKQVFRLLAFGMDYLSVCVVSYVAALLLAVMVEFPCASLWQLCTTRRFVRPAPAERLVELESTSGFHSQALPTYGSTFGSDRKV